MICLSDVQTELDMRAWSSGERWGGDINIEVIGTWRYFKLRGRMRSSRERVWRKERKWPWGGSMSGRRGEVKKRDCAGGEGAEEPQECVLEEQRRIAKYWNWPKNPLIEGCLANHGASI